MNSENTMLLNKFAISLRTFYTSNIGIIRKAVKNPFYPSHDLLTIKGTSYRV